MSAPAYPDPVTRQFITASVMAATMMTSLDTTIANVALPHIQGSVSASQEEISWVLTSYIIAGAIFTPLTGWLASRFGRRRLILISIVGFTLTSGLCGIARNLEELVGFRLLQGAFGAALVPMSQAILLDINPPERHGPAMAVWGMGAILGPIIGPTLGGWLTENLDWRWVFYINLPVGAVCFVGLSAFLGETPLEEDSRLDFFGFTTLALALASFQLMLDRGQQQDWFSSAEICIEATSAAFFFYLFFAHTLTAEKPFINLALFKDVNFTAGCLFGIFLGVVLYGVLALMPPMLEGLMGYPVILTGLVTAPRGIGTMCAMIVAGRLVRIWDPRILLITGLLVSAVSLHMMSGFSLQMDSWQIIISALIQGMGTGLVFLSVSTIAFATLDTKFRNEGTAMYTLIRNISAAIGISVLQAMTIRNTATVHSRLVEGVRPDNPAMAWRMADFDFDAPSAVAAMNAQITRQAGMVSYIDVFWALFIFTIVTTPLILFMRRPKRAPGDAPAVHLD